MVRSPIGLLPRVHHWFLSPSPPTLMVSIALSFSWSPCSTQDSHCRCLSPNLVGSSLIQILRQRFSPQL